MNKIINLYRKSFQGLSKEVWLLSFVALINRSGTMVFPFLSVLLQDELGFTKIQIGIILTFFGIGSLIGNALGGKLADKYGYYYIQLLSLIFTGFAFFGLVYVKSFYYFCGASLLLNIIAEAFRPANLLSITVFSKPENATRSVSLIRLAINLGYAIGPAIGGVIIAHYAYQWVFIADGITCILAGVFFYFVIENKSMPVKEVTEEDIESTGKPVYKNKKFMMLLGFQVLGIVAFFQIFSTLPLYYKEVMFLSEDYIGYLMAFNGLLIAVIELPLIFVIENKYTKMQLILLGNILIGISFLILNFSLFPLIAIIGMALISIGEILDFPFNYSLAIDLSDEDKKGTYLGWYAMSYSVSLIIAPLWGMWVVDSFGYEMLWYLCFGLSLVAGLGVYFKVKD